MLRHPVDGAAEKMDCYKERSGFLSLHKNHEAHKGQHHAKRQQEHGQAAMMLPNTALKAISNTVAALMMVKGSSGIALREVKLHAQGHGRVHDGQEESGTEHQIQG